MKLPTLSHNELTELESLFLFSNTPRALLSRIATSTVFERVRSTGDRIETFKTIQELADTNELSDDEIKILFLLIAILSSNGEPDTAKYLSKLRIASNFRWIRMFPALAAQTMSVRNEIQPTYTLSEKTSPDAIPNRNNSETNTIRNIYNEEYLRPSR